MKRRVYCKRCGYSLRGIESGACPECGQVFDLNNPRTYLRFAIKELPFDVWITLVLQVVVLVLVAALWIITIYLNWSDWWRFNGPYFSCGVFMLQLAAMFCGLASAVTHYRRTVPGYRIRLVVVALIPWLIAIVAILVVIMIEALL